jgi:hypothetical protein
MEGEVDDASAVAANGATAAGLLDQQALDLLLAARDRFPNASLAPPSTLPVARRVVGELRGPVPPALAHLDCARARERGRPTRAIHQRDAEREGIVVSCHEQTFAYNS